VNSNTGFGHNFELRQLVDERSIHPHCSGSYQSTDGLRIFSQICFFVALLPQWEHSVLRLQQTLEVGQGAVHEHMTICPKPFGKKVQCSYNVLLHTYLSYIK
jgi:hypothetical protein